MRLWWLLLGLLLPSIGWAATGDSLTIAISPKGVATLDRAIAPGGSHEGLTRTQVIQRATNAFLQNLIDQQIAADGQLFIKKLEVTSTSLASIRNAINAGIDPPVVTTIATQTNNVGQSPIVPIVASDPTDGKPLRITATGLPPGLIVSVNAEGAPQMSGTLTTAGTYTVTVHAFKLGDIEGTTTFTWTVNTL